MDTCRVRQAGMLDGPASQPAGSSITLFSLTSRQRNNNLCEFCPRARAVWRAMWRTFSVERRWPRSHRRPMIREAGHATA